MTLVWKDIIGYEGKYQVNNYGQVKSLKSGRILKQYLNKYGYYQVTLSKDNKAKLYRVHRLVAMSFLKSINNKTQVNHINGNKKDNRLENLEWCNSSENLKHAYKNGLQKPKKGKDNVLSKKTYQYDTNLNLIKEWDSVADIVRELNITKQQISACCLGKTKTTRGFIFTYSPLV